MVAGVNMHDYCMFRFSSCVNKAERSGGSSKAVVHWAKVVP